MNASHQALETNTIVKSLTLGEFFVDAETADALVAALNVNTTLLGLRVNLENVSARIALDKALARNNALATLGAMELLQSGADAAVATTLDLSKTLVPTKTLVTLASALKSNTSLEVLNLGDAEFDAAVTTAFVEALAVNKTLKELRANVTDVSARISILKALARNNTPREAMEIVMEEVDVTETIVAVSAAEGLVEETYVEETVIAIVSNVPDTIVTEVVEEVTELVGETALLDSVANASLVTSLDLSNARLTIKAVISLVSALKSNVTLEFLNLGNAELDSTATHALVDALSVNTTLKELRVNVTDVSARIALDKALARNNGSVDADAVVESAPRAAPAAEEVVETVEVVETIEVVSDVVTSSETVVVVEEVVVETVEILAADAVDQTVVEETIVTTEVVSEVPAEVVEETTVETTEEVIQESAPRAAPVVEETIETVETIEVVADSAIGSETVVVVEEVVVEMVEVQPSDVVEHTVVEETTVTKEMVSEIPADIVEQTVVETVEELTQIANQVDLIKDFAIDATTVSYDLSATVISSDTVAGIASVSFSTSLMLLKI
ncbi:hypothetical protein BC830DRAFT_99617 [Chytriomyces sp. MP71]|nr:hypothetical protein BC830DRAFT_99617 [Chytriomyces sp. MP71]